jgi:hypothetical protein
MKWITVFRIISLLSSSIIVVVAFVTPSPCRNQQTIHSQLAPIITTTTTSTKIFTSSQPINHPLSSRSIESLDLEPLMKLIARHAGTRRGHLGLLQLVNIDSSLSQQKQPRWKAIPNSSKSLAYFATDLQQAQQEYQMVQEATSLILSNQIPPIYGIRDDNHDHSPTMKTEIPETDHDEWVDLESPEQFTLEDILQAVQILKTLKEVQDWCVTHQYDYPFLAKLGIDIQPLPQVLQELENTVEIVRHPSATVTTTTTTTTKQLSYNFRLQDDKFPSLRLLRFQKSKLLANGAKELDRDMIELQTELDETTSQIQWGLALTLLKANAIIQEGLDSIAQMDILLAKASFGIQYNGKIPIIGNQNKIEVSGFCHPILASSQEVIPIDLLLLEQKALIISGPNGGGKTLALKSFGVVSLLAKLGIPIPSSQPNPRVDFFDTLHVTMGDTQTLEEGTSTWTSFLTTCSTLLNKLSSQSQNQLILMDELGHGGTDPTAGGAMAQAILEALMTHPNCRMVATTHSPRLKTLSYSQPQYNCATVLLLPSKIPNFQLQYGVIGESYALEAAARISNPALPLFILNRAQQLLTQEDDDDISTNENSTNRAYWNALTQSLQDQVQLVSKEHKSLQQHTQDMANLSKAMRSLAASYEQHFSRLESKLEDSYKQLSSQNNKNDLEVVGDTLAQLKVVHKQVKTQSDLLKEQGLRLLPPDYKLAVGESVMIINGQEVVLGGSTTTVEVVSDEGLGPNQVLVQSSFRQWDDEDEGPFVVARHQLAIWDYESAWEDTTTVPKATSTRDSKRRLSSLLSTLKTPTTMATTKASLNSSSKPQFTSARERKAAKNDSDKKGKKKKGKKR